MVFDSVKKKRLAPYKAESVGSPYECKADEL